jgi:hypothetical protein
MSFFVVFKLKLTVIDCIAVCGMIEFVVAVTFATCRYEGDSKRKNAKRVTYVFVCLISPECGKKSLAVVTPDFFGISFFLL